MKKRFFIFAILCILLSSVPSQAALRQFSTPTPIVASTAEGSPLYPNRAEPLRFISSNTEYSTTQTQLTFSITNKSLDPVTICGDGSLEVDNSSNRFFLMPRHETASLGENDSGLLSEAIGKTIQPGETSLVGMNIAHYQPLTNRGTSAPFPEGKYRVSLTFQPENGDAYQWASFPFRMVSGEAQTMQSNVSISASRASYAPATKQLIYQIQNATDGEILCTGDVTMQKQSGANWINMGDAPTSALTAQPIPSGETLEGTMVLEYKLSEGTYRLTAEMAGLNFVSGQFTVPGKDRLRLGITPVQASVDWYALGEQKRVRQSWWSKNQAGRDIWLSKTDLYEGQSAPEALLLELEAFRESEEPLGYQKDIVVEVTLWDAKEKNVTASIFSNTNGTYCLVSGKWYQSGDTNVLTRLKTALDAVASI